MTGYGPVTPDDVDHDEDGPQGAEWLGHRDMCSLQWSNRCDCNDPPCCQLVADDSDSGIAHGHANGDLFACKPTRCPGCQNCPRSEDE